MHELHSSNYPPRGEQSVQHCLRFWLEVLFVVSAKEQLSPNQQEEKFDKCFLERDF